MIQQTQSFKTKSVAVVISLPLPLPRLPPVFKRVSNQRSGILGWSNRQSIVGLVTDGLAVESNLQPPSDTNALVNDQHVPRVSDVYSNIDPILLTESMPAHPLPNGSSIMPRFSTPSLIPGGNAVKEHVPNVREPPPATQLNIPVTRIIPPTPIDATTSLVGADDYADAGTSLRSQAEPSSPMAGRRTALINSILDEGYNDLENILTQLVNKTALSPQQIMDGWHKSKGRVINGVNHCNLYAKYLAKHEDQERRRLGLPADDLSKLMHLVLKSLS